MQNPESKTTEVDATLRALVKQAKDGNAGLVAISVATAERIIKWLEADRAGR